ncbi:MAG: tetratricopeptide repeat protein, partial [Anaerolineae bacterium]
MENSTSTDIDKLIAFGQMALEQGWYDQAREHFEEALALDPSNLEAMKGLARVNEILSRKAAMPVEPMEAETPTGPPLAERLMAGVNS